MKWIPSVSFGVLGGRLFWFGFVFRLVGLGFCRFCLFVCLNKNFIIRILQ